MSATVLQSTVQWLSEHQDEVLRTHPFSILVVIERCLSMCPNCFHHYE